MLITFPMEMSETEKTRKRQFAFWCVGLALPISLGFMVVDFIEGAPKEAIINIVIMGTLIGGLITLKTLNRDLWVYGSAMALISMIFLYNISIGSGRGIGNRSRFMCGTILQPISVTVSVPIAPKSSIRNSHF